MDTYSLGKDIQEIKDRLTRLEGLLTGHTPGNGTVFPKPIPSPDPNPNPDPDARVVSVDGVFYTTSNDKDHDTVVDVRVYNNQGVLVAEALGLRGHWNDHSSTPFALALRNSVTKTAIPAGSVRITTSSNGNDKWEFNYGINIHYSDGSVTSRAWSGKVLAQDNPESNDSWVGV